MYTAYPHNPNVHRILPTEPDFLGFLRREFRLHGPHMFVYQHAYNNLYVLAGWANKARGRCVDLLILGPVCQLTKQNVRELHSLLEPTAETELTPDALAKREVSGDRNENQRLQDEVDEMQDVKRHLFKKLVKDGDGGPGWMDVRHPLTRKGMVV